LGFSISWLAVRGKAKDKILEALSLVDTNQIDEANESPISGATIPDGWYVIWLNRFDHALASHSSVSGLSSYCEIVGCQVEEHVMVSLAHLYRDGVKSWSVMHDSQKSGRHLEVAGSVPDDFEEVRNRLNAEQDNEDSGDRQVDFIFDVPVETAERVCGFRHDKWEYDWGSPKFTALESTKKSFWRR
jgi:hypothetical protein